MRDFFISYNREDKSWAEWIASTLSKANYTLTIQAWDFLPGSNFVLEMQRATVDCKRTIAVLSPDWLASIFTQPEWAAAFALDPTGTNRKLIPIRVRTCEPSGLLRSIVYCDLIGLGEEDAQRALINAVKEVPSRPSSVAFPGDVSQTTNTKTPKRKNNRSNESYPGTSSTVQVNHLPSLVKCALDLLSLLRTTRATFEAQAKLRDSLVRRIHERLIINPYQKYEFEEFFARHSAELDTYEKQIFNTIRSFTTTVLRNYNQKILDLISACIGLNSYISSIDRLKDHLLLWLAKFEGVFLNTPEMCLLYVGVNEGIPFPRQIELETWDFLNKQGETSLILQTEPSPPSKLEEHSSPNSNWMISLRHKWLRKQINELELERNKLLSRIEGSTATSKLSQEDKKAILEIDKKLSEYWEKALAPYMSMEKIVDPAVLIALLQELVRTPDESWPAEFSEVLARSKTALENYGFFWQFKALLPLLPTLAFYVEELKLSNSLNTIWQGIHSKLKELIERVLNYD